MFFPGKYKKPVLQNVVDASKNGWNATCVAEIHLDQVGSFVTLVALQVLRKTDLTDHFTPIRTILPGCSIPMK